MALLTQWTWVWASSWRWWRSRKLGMLQSMGSQRVGHDWVTEQQHAFCTTTLFVFIFLKMFLPFKKWVWKWFYFLFYLFWLWHVACGILLPWLRMKSATPTLRQQSLNWTTREFPLTLQTGKKYGHFGCILKSSDRLKMLMHHTWIL